MNVVGLVDAGGANLGSVRYAFERLGAEVRIVHEAHQLADCERVVLPGVGAAAPAMALLRERGLDAALRGTALPLLGICLGMQLLFEYSEEGGVACLGRLPGRVQRMASSDGVRVPHMGWNRLRHERPSALTAGIADGEQAYFVHGYAVPVDEACIASCVHGERFSAVAGQGTTWGVQFHPERSAAAGARLLSNFLAMAP